MRQRRAGHVGRVVLIVALAFTPMLAQDGDWSTYSGTYASHRFSPLAQITPDRVSKLRPLWTYDPPGIGSLETTPLFVDGVLYGTSGPAAVFALDPKSGKPLWEWVRAIAPDVRHVGFPRTNRGVAVRGDTVYVGTLDGHLVALDARNGTERWTVHVGDNSTGHAITAAPLVVDDKVIVGVSGGDAGIRGFLDAYDAKTGKQLWRYWTVPSPGEPGGTSWSGDSWVRGGGATWLTGSYDPELKLLYWGTGNPSPDWNGDSRLGDNLHTSSLIAIEVDTGKARWSFQFTPHDTHDWDANQIPVLVDAEFNGQPRSLVVTANRNAFFYVLDRKTGEYLLGAEYTKQTWAKSLDARGRPIEIPASEPSEKGTVVYPSPQGATTWASPSYSPQTGWFYATVSEMGSTYVKANTEYRPGTFYSGGTETRLDEEARGAVRAIDIATGKRMWNFPLPAPTAAGVMATAGGLVFSGSNEGNFYALDASSGEPLWQFKTAGQIRSGPMSFLANGKQHVAISGGRTLYVFALADSD